jgi:outer membrane murein-binding lipoprotein Lpp
MSPQRVQYARRSVWYLVAILSIVVVVGFAATGYEINHQRNEINGLHSQVQQLNGAIAELSFALKQLSLQGK